MFVLTDHFLHCCVPPAAMYLIFKDAPNTNFSDPAEAVMGMFMMSLGEFGDLYDTFDHIQYQTLAIVYQDF